MNKTALIAEALVDSGALKFGTFKLKSGKMSPFYIDLTWLLSSPKDFQQIVDAVADKVQNIKASQRIDKLASIELKGALLLPSIAIKVGIPCLVVRKEAKDYGMTGRITGGEVKTGERILFIDDVVTDGTSKTEGIKPLIEAGAKVDNILVVIDREQGGKQNLEKSGFQLHALARISELARSLAFEGKISKEQTSAVLDYVKRY